LQLKGCCPKTTRKKNLEEAKICILQKFIKSDNLYRIIADGSCMGRGCKNFDANI
jgi:hypothetical protein